MNHHHPHHPATPHAATFSAAIVQGAGGAAVALIGTATAARGTGVQTIDVDAQAAFLSVGAVTTDGTGLPAGAGFTLTDPSGTVIAGPSDTRALVAQTWKGNLVTALVASPKPGKWTLTATSDGSAPFWVETVVTSSAGNAKTVDALALAAQKDPLLGPALKGMIAPAEEGAHHRRSAAHPEAIDFLCFPCQLTLFIPASIAVAWLGGIRDNSNVTVMFVAGLARVGVVITAADGARILNGALGMSIKAAAKYLCQQIGAC